MTPNLHEIALRLAPALRDKFDFSTDEQFKAWADISYKAAKAFSVNIPVEGMPYEIRHAVRTEPVSAVASPQPEAAP